MLAGNLEKNFSSSSDGDKTQNIQVMTPSPTNTSREMSPTTEDPPADCTSQMTQKKKKKKKPKKSKSKDSADAAAKAVPESERPPVLCISRNKHWRYISSYHGPWLQLPVELLESLLVLNLDPATLSAPDPQLPALPSPPQTIHNSLGNNYPRTPNRMRDRDRAFPNLSDYTPPESPRGAFPALQSPYTTNSTAPPFPSPAPGKATPPPIDPGVFRNVAAIRRLIDEAAELSVRASSGLSAAALGSMRGPGGNNGAWAAAQALGLDGSGQNSGGRNVAMSAMRIHRLRALAVQKLSAAYKADEIASSVMVMQGGSVFDDIAERVLKHDPNDVDARYVHFFHEKIPSRPSRQLAESTTTQVLDELIAAQPQRLEFYRTRGIVHCFRDEYPAATKDFTYALKEARAVRKAQLAHKNIASSSEQRGKNGKKKKASGKSNGQAPPSGTSAVDGPTIEGLDGEPLLLHPSVLPNAPDPIEPQLLFLRGAAYLQHAVYLIEAAILKLENVSKTPASLDGAELRLCYIEGGRYGGVEIGNLDGPLGRSDGAKARAYTRVLADENSREQINTLLRKAMRDHERFLTHFDTLEGPPPNSGSNSEFVDLARRVEVAFLLTESVRPGNHMSTAAGLADVDSILPAVFTTYHPLLVESHFSLLICLLMLGDLPTLLTSFSRAAVIVDGLEGYPVFLPPRSMAQAEFIEVLERLAAGWKVGIQPHSFTRATTAIGKLAAIEAPPPLSPLISIDAMSTSSGDTDTQIPFASTSTARHNAATPIPPTPGHETPTSASDQSRVDLVEALDCIRILLVPVAARQKERAEKAAAEKAAKTNKNKPLNINIPLHGPRVEIMLAWLAAVHLVELESVA
ncbi:hypothetical protein BJ138DRAFT_1141179 [Hygrophoropsis aurantiaca]|uniref:Uncharacterized protein n=1 Tax=Hygrophoropsis aurantiaca TaxID=72124 RepID=A0ACB8AS22_9AGAM|nr:hypothetical protein BJ138DRAFT_1141179 [Hygrophoropsis aurantiaca]